MKKDYIVVLPDRNNEKTFHGNIIIYFNKVTSDFFNDIFKENLLQLVTLLRSPFAFVSCDEMYRKYQERIVPENGFSREILTVKDYSCGLNACYWLMCFGKEYVNHFGKPNLESAPLYYKNDYNGIYCVQLYETPDQWDTEIGIKASEDFKNAADRNTFYDPDDPEKKLNAPDFSHLLI